MDPWHALQRIRKLLLQANWRGALKQASKELSTILWEDETKHVKATPDPQIIICKVNAWKEKYAKHITQAVQDAIDNLRPHIIKGCLSQIPPKFGTGRSELLHRHLNNLFHSCSSIGPRIMEAQLTRYIFRFANTKRSRPIPSFQEYCLMVAKGEIVEEKLSKRPSIWQTKDTSSAVSDFLKKPPMISGVDCHRSLYENLLIEAKKIFEIHSVAFEGLTGTYAYINIYILICICY